MGREGQRKEVNDWKEGETPNLTRCTGNTPRTCPHWLVWPFKRTSLRKLIDISIDVDTCSIHQASRFCSYYLTRPTKQDQNEIINTLFPVRSRNQMSKKKNKKIKRNREKFFRMKINHLTFKYQVCFIHWFCSMEKENNYIHARY